MCSVFIHCEKLFIAIKSLVLVFGKCYRFLLILENMNVSLLSIYPVHTTWCRGDYSFQCTKSLSSWQEHIPSASVLMASLWREALSMSRPMILARSRSPSFPMALWEYQANSRVSDIYSSPLKSCGRFIAVLKVKAWYVSFGLKWTSLSSAQQKMKTGKQSLLQSKYRGILVVVRITNSSHNGLFFIPQLQQWQSPGSPLCWRSG